jgi:hypothetical protein
MAAMARGPAIEAAIRKAKAATTADALAQSVRGDAEAVTIPKTRILARSSTTPPSARKGEEGALAKIMTALEGLSGRIAKIEEFVRDVAPP